LLQQNIFIAVKRLLVMFSNDFKSDKLRFYMTGLVTLHRKHT